MLQIPSFGYVLHQLLLCLCKSCNEFTHHDSTEMSRDHEYGVFRRHHARVMQGEGGIEGCRLSELFRRVGVLCMYSVLGVNLLVFGIFC